MHDERIENDFCKEIFESKNKVLPDFVEIIVCSEHFIKSLKKNKYSRGYSLPS